MRDFSVNEVRSKFPALRKDKAGGPIFFDGPGGTQMAQKAIDSMVGYIEEGMANLHGTFSTSITTDLLLDNTRAAVGALLHCKAEEVAFGQNMTSLAFQVSRNLRSLLEPGDEIVVTEQDHRANVDPWLSLARETGARVKFIPVDPETFTLDLSELEEIITPRTKLVAAGLSSNVTGTITDIGPIIARAKEMKALTVLDAVHAVPHFQVDFSQLGCDILFCSAYKFFGPHIGIVVIREAFFSDMVVQKVEPAPGEIPYKLETGTQNHEAIAGLLGTLEFLEGLGTGSGPRQKMISAMEKIEAYELLLIAAMERILANTSGIQVYRAPAGVSKAPTFAFKINNTDSREAAAFFAEKYDLNLGDGNFYASTLAEKLNADGNGGWIRVGFAPYNTLEEVEVFHRALKACINYFSPEGS